MLHQTLTICKGLSASGKSTWAKEQVKQSGGKTKRINKDDLRAMLDPNWTSNKELFILKARNTLLNEALICGFNVIIDDTNLAGNHIDDIMNIAADLIAEHNLNINIIINDSFLAVPIETCIERDAKRGHDRVGMSVILRQAKTAGLIDSALDINPYNKNDVRPEAEYIPGLHSAIICDLDGTLALMQGNRTSYECEKCLTDTLNKPVYNLICQFDNVILVSGRNSSSRKETEAWLANHNVKYLALHMRDETDTRPDNIVKDEIYKNYIKNKYNIQFVLDDRDQVVQMWRDNGILCLQVWTGNF